MVKVLIKKLDEQVEIPNYKTAGASGVDLMAFIKKPIKLSPNSSCIVPTGLSVAFSNEYEIQIRPRSGLAAKNNISVLNTPGTIDSDYRGEIKIILYNHGKSEFIINNKSGYKIFKWKGEILLLKTFIQKNSDKKKLNQKKEKEVLKEKKLKSRTNLLNNFWWHFCTFL